jgi:hypothetical protein
MLALIRNAFKSQERSISKVLAITPFNIFSW